MARMLSKKTRRARSQEGAAMIVVMLILMAATVGATFAVHATTMELRSAGQMRQALQTEYVGETGAVAALDYVTRIGPQGLLYAISQSTASASVGVNPYAEYGEPPPADAGFGGASGARKPYYRMTCDPSQSQDDFSAAISGVAGGKPLETTSLGLHTNRTARFTVDINDHYTYQMPSPGARSDGRGTFHFLGATITSRGRTAIEGIDSAGRPTTDPVTAGLTIYRKHETSNDARAQLISGPFAM